MRIASAAGDVIAYACKHIGGAIVGQWVGEVAGDNLERTMFDRRNVDDIELEYEREREKRDEGGIQYGRYGSLLSGIASDGV